MHTASQPPEARAAVFEAWMRAWEDDVLRLCYLYLADRALAEDALQDTFTKVWRGMEGFQRRNGCSARTWIMRIAVNTCRDYRRSAWFRHRAASQPLEEAPQASLAVPQASRELFLDVMALPDKYRQVLVLHHFQGMELQEAARALGISRQAAGRRLKKAYELLRGSMEGGYEDEA